MQKFKVKQYVNLHYFSKNNQNNKEAHIFSILIKHENAHITTGNHQWGDYYNIKPFFIKEFLFYKENDDNYELHGKSSDCGI